MSASSQSPETLHLSITLIVASTPSLGIGLRGSLPWPPLKSDLQFFARITKRPPPLPPQSTSPRGQLESTGEQTKKIRNALIMGRKTFDSIPPKNRPLKDRYNVVVSRNPTSFLDSHPGTSDGGVIAVSSISSGLQQLQSQNGETLGRVFVIGGAEIYKEVLKMRECDRVLWTRLDGEWDCDTWFPEGVIGDGVAEGGQGENGWRRRTRRELEEWTGEDGVGGPRKEGEVDFEISMWERQRGEG